MIPLHFWSVEHAKLTHRFGKEKGIKIGEYLGIVSGWGLFMFSIGLWLSPQPRLEHPFNLSLKLSVMNLTYKFSPIYMPSAIVFVFLGAFFGINGVKETSLRVSETHRTERIATSGVYSIIRHPQYLGGIFSHIGISILLTAYLALVITPLIVAMYYALSFKEEKELVNEFGKEYIEYIKKVPMLVPRFKKNPSCTTIS